MGCGLVPFPVVVVSFPPLSSPPLGARLCWQCWVNGPCATGSLVPGARCIPCGWGLGGVRLVRVPGSWGCRGNIGVGRALSPLLGCCCCPRARRCGFPPGVDVLVLLLHHVLCLCWVCGLSCVPCPWAWRYRLCVHLVLRVVTCACAPYTGLAGGIPLALGFGVSWVLLARCSPLHILRSLCQVSEPMSGSHVEELRHKG